MTDHIENGGPAFPFKSVYRDSQGIDHEIVNKGLTLRDWFAGQALMGIGAWCPRNCEPGSPEWHEARVKLAYRDADAMLDARKGGAA
ncbi:hypothetical protein SAMN04489859_102051 [Paracoccus alcaliphilus]|uniref:Uncharacterized protein n=1 Tax=Paracoccus alcaliphilus TaxID=34002 RepID=A0A1H8K5Z3_9RHOB|nr:hypothetical protein [Paracoccus alcaliphilus]WCR17546.1 hypothetical protein JHW40_14595 [Paracoccus alcaliphilus]SEN87808.1 hypothetical protein SAMN04489859_102051 [Paracoccus alcaliphilus]